MVAIISRRLLKLLYLSLIALAFLFAAFPGAAMAGEPVKMHFFMTQECPHCRAEKAFLEKLKQKYPELQIIAHEVTKSEDEARYFVKMSEAYGAKVAGVPATFIGHFSPVIGFQNESTTGVLIESRVKYCADSGCIDPAERVLERFPLIEPTPSENLLLGGEQPSDESICPDDVPCVEGEEMPPQEAVKEIPAPAKVQEPPKAEETTPVEAKAQEPPKAEEPSQPPTHTSAKENVIAVPLVGKIEVSGMALPVLTVTIAALDGFNPCAFFVLLTLMGMLVHVHSRQRMFIVGGIFVFFSGFIYFIFMAAWLNIFLLSGEIKAITIIAGLVALVIAVINIKDYFYFRRGVSLSIPDSAKPKLFDRMRKLLKASSLTSIIIGTVVLAVAANAYELLCTAGFPMVFTRVLTLHELSATTYYLYLVLYNVVYVVPLAVIVILFTITLGSKKLSEHQGQILKLVSGVMMLYLALVILFKPALLGNLLVAGSLLVAALATSGLVMLLSGALHRPKKD